MEQVKDSQENYRKPSPKIVAIVRCFSLFFSKIFWRIEFLHTENIPQDIKKGLIVSANHPTYLDPFWIGISIKNDLRFMAWDEAFEIFFIGRLLSLLGAFPVSLERGGTIKALKESLKVLRKGKTLFVFPEGEREFADGKLLPFKTGAIRLALEANVPILPVTVRGGNKIWSRDHYFPRLGKVQIIYHPIIEFSKPDNKENLQAYIEDMNKNLEKIIASEM